MPIRYSDGHIYIPFVSSFEHGIQVMDAITEGTVEVEDVSYSDPWHLTAQGLCDCLDKDAHKE